MSIIDIKSSAYIGTHTLLEPTHQFNDRMLCLVYHTPETVELMTIHVAKWMNLNGRFHINIIIGQLGVAIRIKPGQRQDTKLDLKFNDVVINGAYPYVLNDNYSHLVKSVEQWETAMKKALNPVTVVTPQPSSNPIDLLKTKVIDSIKDENRIIFWGRPLEELKAVVKMISDSYVIASEMCNPSDSSSEARWSIGIMALAGNDWMLSGNTATRISNPGHTCTAMNSSAKIIILAVGSMEDIEKSGMLNLVDREFKVIRFTNPIPMRPAHRFVEI